MKNIKNEGIIANAENQLRERVTRRGSVSGGVYPALERQTSVQAAKPKANYVNPVGLNQHDKHTPGSAARDKFSAVMTQADDAMLEHIAYIFGNKDRAVGLPMWSTHDANTVNARSALIHDSVYNHIGLSEVVNHADYYRQVYRQLQSRLKKLKKRFQGSDDPVDFSDLPGGEFDGLIGFFDRKWQQLQKIQDPEHRDQFSDTKGREWIEAFFEDDEANLTKLLGKAKKLGWIPPEDDLAAARAENFVTGDDLYSLIALQAEDAGIHPNDKRTLKAIEALEKSRKKLNELVRKAWIWRPNSQSETKEPHGT